MSRRGSWDARSGVTELNQSYPINLFRGLLISAMLHFIGLSAFWIDPREPVYSDPNPKNPTIIIKFPTNPSASDVRRRLRTGNPHSNTQRAIIPFFVRDLMSHFEPIVDTLNFPSLTVSDSSNHWEAGGSATGIDGLGGIEDTPIFDPRIETYPDPTKRVQPVYPEIAVKSRIEGTVHVRVLIDKKGKVIKAVVIKTDNSILERAALDAVNKWQFTPGMMGRDPVPVWMTIPFRFRLTKNAG